ncbi:hypothetical protein [Candidatus Burkholderia verschuerenii]|uniref:hypothetical protein n=1 Tax=Candidatus Burkholderia verschuerenii TaxID=242163 RepID=UPI00067C1753|nr:hypothetical protein [Candidatus Burkholderia verschuerenii]
MNPARFILGPKTAIASLIGGLLLSGCYYGYSPYPGGYYSPVPVAYTQREFSLPQGASGVAAASAPSAQTQYIQASPSADYYADYYAMPAASTTYYTTYPAYPYAAYPAYPAYYGYPYPPVSVAFGFGYWGGGGGCCWGHGWHGNGWHGGGGYHGGGGWHGGGSSWQGGGGWHGGGGRSH